MRVPNRSESRRPESGCSDESVSLCPSNDDLRRQALLELVRRYGIRSRAGLARVLRVSERGVAALMGGAPSDAQRGEQGRSLDRTSTALAQALSAEVSP